MRTYYSLLRSSEKINIETLAESHIAIESSLHVKASQLELDVAALLYSALRLPPQMAEVSEVLISQTEKLFIDAGYRGIMEWKRVFAAGRRRRMHFDGRDRLAVYIVSRSDIDDLIPILTAYQIEWNKLHTLLQDTVVRDFLQNSRTGGDLPDDQVHQRLAELLNLAVEDIRRLEMVWENGLVETLLGVAASRKQLTVQLLSGSLADYRRATANWWDDLYRVVKAADVDPEQRPVYFVSSNTHSLINLLTGFARRYEDEIVQHIKDHEEQALLAEYQSLRSQPASKSLDNFLYFVLRHYLEHSGANVEENLQREARQIGIFRIPNKHGFEIEAQIIELKALEPQWIDPRVTEGIHIAGLQTSSSLIINIDYPLGLAAYEMLSRITERVGAILGVYVMGKAATLNGRVGDLMIPNVVHDEHSQNTYLFDNCFSGVDVRPFMTVGNILDNQKAVTALGTFLQNPVYMDVFYVEGYTDIEMEAGPYLSAVYEAFRPQRHPYNEIVNLYNVPFDIGFLHYASDTPRKRGQNLGAGSLRLAGVEATYASAIAILRRILTNEQTRLGRSSPVRTSAAKENGNLS
jgi:hypothetical protein